MLTGSVNQEFGQGGEDKVISAKFAVNMAALNPEAARS